MNNKGCGLPFVIIMAFLLITIGNALGNLFYKIETDMISKRYERSSVSSTYKSDSDSSSKRHYVSGSRDTSLSDTPEDILGKGGKADRSNIKKPTTLDVKEPQVGDYISPYELRDYWNIGGIYYKDGEKLYCYTIYTEDHIYSVKVNKNSRVVESMTTIFGPASKKSSSKSSGTKTYNRMDPSKYDNVEDFYDDYYDDFDDFDEAEKYYNAHGGK